ncbi:protein phosphatase 2C domain-containing protein [Glycomyces xiaoerkulensis]|uniref:protein phosphatase 2C domain-containing protein n=1 Tax=Glycomyces xiaoerkulensis TaxID=2038139 RepID=UPI000C26B595|nr:protein phosphatase 2C domain-containing protein [Glycomyces xiaoerkulensis]
MLAQTSAATLAGGSAPNEDFYLVSNSWAVVLDGVTRYPDDGCVHDVPWYVAALGGALAERLSQPDRGLRSCLADAIEAVADRHRATCDLANRLSPAATVAIARFADDRFEWLVLGDAAVVWQVPGRSPQVESDDRLGRLEDPPAPIDVGGIERYPTDYIARVRNRPGGFWVASTDPEASRQARAGVLPAGELETVGLFSDGLTRLVERYGRSWDDVLGTAAFDGVPGVLTQVREAENNDPEIRARAKRHDDATGVILRLVITHRQP